jgi:signal transduction histidine kinase
VGEHAPAPSRLQQSRRLESIGRVAGGVAHDFNNLLTVINGYSQILLMGPLSSDTREEIQQINKAGRRAVDLTNQLLTVSRRQITDVIPLDLNTVIHDAEPLLRRLAGEDVQLVIAPGSWRAPRATSARPTSIDEPGGQRPRRDGGGRPHRYRHRERLRARARGPSGRTGARRLRRAVGERHRLRHERRHTAAHLRTVLLDQGRSRHRPRPVHRLRHRAPAPGGNRRVE